MAKIINIIEKDNKLNFEIDHEPIVCGNTNYILHFNFSEEWSKCNQKTAIFVANGESIKILFEGNECKVPLFANLDYFKVGLITSDAEGEQLTTTFLKVNMERSAASVDFSEADHYQNYIADIKGMINSLGNGNTVVKDAINAEKATEADHAINADYATVAGSCESQVDLTNNQTISGVKNFVGELLSNGKKVAVIDSVSNQNLIVNGDFKINQRGKTNYLEDNKYTVDRWQLIGGNITVNSDGSVTHNAALRGQGIRQFIDHPELLSGMTTTFTVKTENILDAEMRVMINNVQYSYINSNISDNKYLIMTTIFPELKESDKVCLELYSRYDNKSVNWIWAKLETGDYIPGFHPRTYAEELLLCKRYYQKFGYETEYEALGIGQFNTNNTIFASGLYATEMRVKPTMKLTGELNVRSANLYLKATKVENFGSRKSYQLSITTSGTQTAGMACDLFLAQNSFLEYDAEMY